MRSLAHEDAIRIHARRRARHRGRVKVSNLDYAFACIEIREGRVKSLGRTHPERENDLTELYPVTIRGRQLYAVFCPEKQVIVTFMNENCTMTKRVLKHRGTTA